MSDGYQDDDRDDCDEDDRDDHEDESCDDDTRQAHTTKDVTAFKWQGFSSYTDSQQGVISDDDEKLDWQGGDTGEAETLTIDGETYNINWSGTIQTTFTDSDGDSHTEDLIYSYTSDGYYVIPQPGSAFDEGSTIHGFPENAWEDTDGIDYDEVICFTPECRIATSRGLVPAGELRPGDLLQTVDNGLQPLLWAGRSDVPGLRRISADLHPIRIRKDAFGPGMPGRDILVSAQHRFCFSNTGPLFHEDEMLAPAKGLVDGHRILKEKAARGVSYVHLLLERHEILFCEGVRTESFQPSLRMMETLAPRTRADLSRVVGSNLGRYSAARSSLKPWEAPLLARVS